MSIHIENNDYLFVDNWIEPNQIDDENELRCFARANIFDFLIKIGIECKITDSIIHHAMLIFDLFIQEINQTENRDTLYSRNIFNNDSDMNIINNGFLYASIWLSISYKFYGTSPYFNNTTVFTLFDEKVEIEEINQIESNILSLLDFNINLKTAYNYLSLFFEKSQITGKINQKQAYFFLDIIQIDPNSRLVHPLLLAIWIINLVALESPK